MQELMDGSQALCPLVHSCSLRYPQHLQEVPVSSGLKHESWRSLQSLVAWVLNSGPSHVIGYMILSTLPHHAISASFSAVHGGVHL